MTILQTTQLTLRPCRPDDRADFIDLERDPLVMRFLNGGHAVDQDQLDPNATFLMPRGAEPYVWTARRSANDAFVGWFCLSPESETVAELGYRLRREDWSQGLASEGASALMDWGFREAGYDKIVATTNPQKILDLLDKHVDSSRRKVQAIAASVALSAQ